MTASVPRILQQLPDEAVVLDVGGWARPLPRADWVIDIGSYKTRGFFGSLSPDEEERFTKETWVEWDICSNDEWPFEDNQFDFVLCGHTLEDLRDPLWVCQELNRVARAGCIVTPSAAIELCRGVESRFWVGHSHHRWLIWVDGEGLVFFPKPHFVHHPFRYHIPSRRYLVPGVGETVEFAWENHFGFRELFEPSLMQQQALVDDIVSSSTRQGFRTILNQMVSLGAGRARSVDAGDFPDYGSG